MCCGESASDAWDDCPSCTAARAAAAPLGAAAVAAPSARAIPFAPRSADGSSGASAGAAAVAGRRLIGDFFSPAPLHSSSATPAAVISLVDDAVDGDSPAAAAARAAGAALAAVTKPPLSAEAAAREAAILGNTKPAASSRQAQSRSVSVNDGGQRKRKAPSSKPDDAADGRDVAPARTRGLGAGAAKTCTVSAETRLREGVVNGKSIRDHGFVRNSNNVALLWCEPCGKETTTRLDRIKDHINSASHLAAAERAQRRKAKFMYINVEIKAAAARNQVATGAHADSGGVTDKTVRHRLKVLKGWLESGCELEKLDVFRPTMEECSQDTLTGANHMGELIPILRNALLAELRAWLAGKHVQLALDGASREGECFGLTARIINMATFLPETRLIALRCYESSFTGKQLAGVLNQIVHELGIAPLNIVSTSRDRAMYGKVAIDALKTFWRNALDMECLPHTLSHVGERMTHASLTEFHQALSYIWGTSNKARVVWNARMGQAPPRYAANRWWSWWQMMTYVFERWGEIDGYLRDLRDNEFCKESVAKMERLLNGWVEEKRGDATAKPPVLPSRKQHASMRHSIMLELATVVDWGQQFVEVTALLESDGLVVVDVFDMLLRLEYAISMPVWTNVNSVSSAYYAKAVPREAPNALELMKQGIARDMKHVEAVVKPAADYFKSHFGAIANCDGRGAEMSQLTLFFKCVRILDPFKAVQLFTHGDTATDGEMGAGLVDNLAKAFPLLGADPARVVALKREMPTYLVRAGYVRIESGLSAEEKTAALAAWWAAEAASLPAWSALAADVFLVVPSSCAVERVFSVMRDAFDKQQRSAREDYMETSVMLQYNRRPGGGN